MAECRINGSLVLPTEHVFQAKVKGTNRVVGFGSFMFHDDTKQDDKEGDEDSIERPVTPAPKDNTALGLFIENIKASRRKHFCGQKYISEYESHATAAPRLAYNPTKFYSVWKELCVLPEFQGKGVGSQLIEWSFKHFAPDKEYILFEASPDERELLLRCGGWEDLDFKDIDLSEVRGINRGFGKFRMYLMIRKPSSISIISKDES
jgi:GNAT superfamily N-acetyltransferase